MKKLIALTPVLLLLLSCATFQHARDESQVSTLARLLNAGQADALIAQSAVPFLLDQELLVLPKDVAFFWQGIIRAGYRFDGPKLERGVLVGPESYREFRDSMEVRTFLKKYVKKDTRLLELRTSDGRTVLLLVRRTPFSRRIYGFKGPLG